MKRSPSIGNQDIKSVYKLFDIENINTLKMLTKELDPEELSLIRARHNEKKNYLKKQIY
jgi:hypothetical protein